MRLIILLSLCINCKFFALVTPFMAEQQLLKAALELQAALFVD